MNDIKFNQFLLKQKISEGFSSHVYEAINNCNNEKFAIKIFKSFVSKKIIDNEITILDSIKHNQIINMISSGNGLLINKSLKYNDYIIIEYMPNGDLYKNLKFGLFSLDISIYYFKQLLNILIFFKENNLCHRDIKPENLLWDNNYDLKIIDFGFSIICERNEKLNTFLGTENYSSPELLEKREYNGFNNDLFSVGIIFFVMCTGSPPFSKASKYCNYYNLIINNNFNKFWSVHQRRNPKFRFCKNFKLIMEKLFCYNPLNRFSIQKLLGNDLIRNNSTSLSQVKEYMSQRNINN